MYQNTNNKPKDNNQDLRRVHGKHQDLRWVHGIKATAVDVQKNVHNASVFLKKIKARGIRENVADVDINANSAYVIDDLF
jgi:hypothetical protein